MSTSAIFFLLIPRALLRPTGEMMLRLSSSQSVFVPGVQPSTEGPLHRASQAGAKGSQHRMERPLL